MRERQREGEGQMERGDHSHAISGRHSGSSPCTRAHSRVRVVHFKRSTCHAHKWPGGLVNHDSGRLLSSHLVRAHRPLFGGAQNDVLPTKVYIQSLNKTRSGGRCYESGPLSGSTPCTRAQPRESGPLEAVNLSRHKWPEGLVNTVAILSPCTRAQPRAPPGAGPRRGAWVQGPGFRVQGPGSRVQGSRSRVEG